MRPFRDSDDTVDIIWYPAAPDAPVLGYASRIQQLDSVSFPWIAEGVGEVFDTPRPFVNRKVIPFLPLNHVCGTRDDFEVGGTRDASLPPVLYDRNQIPICCGPPFLGEGGAVGTGTATVTVTSNVLPPGSCSTATPITPGVTYTYTLLGSGGDEWWFVPSSSIDPAPYHCDLTGSSGPYDGLWMTGFGCASLVSVALLNHDACTTGFGHVFPSLFVRIIRNASGPITLKIKVENGPC